MPQNSHYQKDRDYHDIIADEYEGVVNEPRSYANNLLFEPLLRQITPPQWMTFLIWVVAPVR